VALSFSGGILLCAENPSRTLHKISEIYDRIGFAGVGRFSEFDSLRILGVRNADVKGFTYSREDVDARSLANAYAQTLHQIFTHEMKPMEVEILVAEVGLEPDGDVLFRIRYDGFVIDEEGHAVIGGEAEAIAERLQPSIEEGDLDLGAAVQAAVSALAGPDRTLAPHDLEAAVLDRITGRRAFRRLDENDLSGLLA